ncbi:MAG: hypothetical protein GYB66_00600 [Chloroflexi bacterium]|nr:hypothetical protein [Chloroflexota bacterium]
MDYIDADVDVCVIGRANDPDYPDADEWYAILLDPDEILPEIYYMSEIVLRPRNPTPTLAPTREPFPTITPLATLANPTQDEAAPTPSLTPPAPDGTETETGIEF